MTTESTAVNKAPVKFGDGGLEISTLDDLYRFAQYVVKGGFAPKGMESPEAVCIAIQMGREVGLSPMAALQNTAIINGRPGIYGDAALALVRASGLLEHYSQEITGTGDNMSAVVKAKRRGEGEYSYTFGVVEAKRAGLWGKQGPWSQYPQRMMIFRARGFVLRDGFGDVLKGFKTVEELSDNAPAVNITADTTVGPAKPSSYQGTERPAAIPAEVVNERQRTSKRQKLQAEAEAMGLTVKPSLTAEQIAGMIANATAKQTVPQAEATSPTPAETEQEKDEKSLNSFLD